MSFDTEITLTGPLRAPTQMLAEQTYGGHASVHDEAEAAKLGLSGAPIEGPTHFSQIDPLAVHHWGWRWFEDGCVSAHFLNMVVEGEEVRASLTPTTATAATIAVDKADGTPVLTGTATLGGADATDLDSRRRRAQGDAGDLFILDRLEIGMTAAAVTVTMDFDDDNGPLYPFTLADKLARITEPCSWYLPDGDSPWGTPIIPTEMISVLAHRRGAEFPVRGPSVGLFIDLEVRLLEGPLFVGRPYRIEHRVVGLGQSRRVESYWTESVVVDTERGVPAARVLLHQGVFKDSYAGYPARES